MNAASPCVRLCQLDDDGLCLGCFRVRDEIARWLRLSDEEKAAVNLAVAARRETYRRNNHAETD